MPTTAAERFSMMRLTVAGSLFPPDTSGLSEGERAAALGLYVGISLGEGPVGLILTFDADVVVVQDLAYDVVTVQDLAYDVEAASELAFSVEAI